MDFHFNSVPLPPKLVERERGSLIMADVKLGAQPGHIESIAPYDPQVWRGAFLLFDRVHHVDNNIISSGRPIDWFGEIPGVTSGQVNAFGTMGGHFFRDAFGEVFRRLDDREPGLWSVARGIDRSSLPDDLLGGLHGFKMKLINALPMPSREVPFDEVISYRERRKSELLALRHHIEELALEAGVRNFEGLAETVKFERFVKSLEEYEAAMRETNFSKVLGSIEIKFNWMEAAKLSTLGGVLFGESLSLKLAAMIGLASVVSIESAKGLRLKSERPRPFEYIFSAQNDI